MAEKESEPGLKPWPLAFIPLLLTTPKACQDGEQVSGLHCALQEGQAWYRKASNAFPAQWVSV